MGSVELTSGAVCMGRRAHACACVHTLWSRVQEKVASSCDCSWQVGCARLGGSDL